MERGYKTGPEHPCSLCGLPTRSRYSVCNRPGKCRAEGKRLSREALAQGLASPCRGLAAEHPCSICGRPTRSSFPMCARIDTRCSVEYQRATDASRKGDWRNGGEGRNAAVRRRRQEQKGEPSVYAIWFPIPQGLKVGFTTDTVESLFVRQARRRAVRRGWDHGGSRCIWRQPGDLRTEAWIQSTLSFRWAAAFEQRDSRICEWFQVPGLTEAKLGAALDEVYGLVPADMVEQPVVTLFS